MIPLPSSITNSRQLTLHHKQLLGNLDSIPSINPSFEDDTLKNILHYYSLSPETMEEELHKYAAKLLDENKVEEAWQVLLTDL